MDLRSALSQLDPTDDSQWTQDGLPLLDVLGTLTNTKVTRQQIAKIAPEFTRSNPIVPEAPPVEGPVSVEPVAETPTAEPPVEPVAETPTAEPPVESKPDDAPEAPSEPESPESARSREAEARLAILDKRTAELTKAKQDIETELAKISREVEFLQRYVPARSYDHKADQKARTEYIQSQHKLRMARAQRTAAAAAALGMPTAKSPLDAALNPRRGFGMRRPKFPLMNNIKPSE